MNLSAEQETALIQTALTGIPTEQNNAINQLLECHRVVLYQYAMRALGDHDKADDAVQGTFVVAWKKMTTGRYTHDPLKEHHFRHWLLSICKNHNLKVAEGRLPDDKILYKTRSMLNPDNNFKSETTPTVNQINRNVSVQQTQDLRNLVDRIDELTLEHLPPAQRRIFRLYAQGFTHTEIGNYLNIKPVTARVSISKAKKILREHLSND